MEKERMSKVKSDFILLSEFAEIRHGPQPILTIPDKAQGLFDISSFSVRVFSTDFQQSPDESFSICPDAQVLITEPCDGAYAYVHYFALNDIQARGYLRQYCICYITNSPNKLMDNFESLKEAFSEVTRLYKCGNHLVFGKDLDHRIADIEYSRKQISLQSNNTQENQKEYNSQLEDIPECNDSVLQTDLYYVGGIMDALSKETKTKKNLSIYLEFYKKQSAQIIQNACYTTGNSKFYAPQDTIDLPEREIYKPKRVMSHVSQRFTRQLRSLDELSVGASGLAITALNKIHKFYSRSELELGIESLELKFVSPVSSLISAGRVPLCNVLNCKRHSANSYNHLLHQHNYTVTSVTSDQLDNTNSYTVSDSGNIEFFDFSFVDIDDVSNVPLYLETIPRQRGLSIVDPLASPGSLMMNKRNLSGLSCSSYTTPETFPTPPDSFADELVMKVNSSDEKGHSSFQPVMEGDEQQIKGHSSDDPDFDCFKDANDDPPILITDNDDCHSPIKFAQTGGIIANNVFSFNDHITNTERHESGFPFISTASLLENKSNTKPGSFLLQYFKDLPELRDILYAILIGLPFVIIAHPKDSRLVMNHIKALWIFVAGHSSDCQVIPWQETPLTLQQFSKVKLIGLSANCGLHNNIKKHVAYWDWSMSILVAPKYNGTLLNPILNRTRDRKDPCVYLSVVLCVLTDIACKAFHYYHGYCIQSPESLHLRKPKMSPPEISAKKLFSVSPEKDKVNFLNNARIKDSDVDIMEYWVEIIRRQQLKEWRSHCSLCRESQNTTHLKMKYCLEKICKPKRQ